MKVETFEGIVENGRIRLTENAELPENTRVFVVVPKPQKMEVRRLLTPHLQKPEYADHFKMTVVEEQ